MPGLFSRLASVFSRFPDNNTASIDMDKYTEELLGMDMSLSVVDRLLGDLKHGHTGVDDLKNRMKDILISSQLCEPRCGILMIGINGGGKTTTIGKLGKWYGDQGYSVIAAAGDTFRAAAIEQLIIVAERAGFDIVKAMPKVDPSSVIHDAVTAYRARGKDVVIADTAGRLHTNVNLINELKKIKSVMHRVMAGDKLVTYLTLDATIGKNSFQQAKLFNEHIGVDGIIITKLDGTARAGIIFTICEELKIPIVGMGTGEGIDDFMLFDKNKFVESLFV